MRLIDANTLNGEFTGNFTDAYPTALVHTLIDSAPTIDAVPAVHGHWIQIEDTGLTLKIPLAQCSNCCKVSAQVVSGNVSYEYCPWCGARMDGDKE